MEMAKAVLIVVLVGVCAKSTLVTRNVGVTASLREQHDCCSDESVGAYFWCDAFVRPFSHSRRCLCELGF